MSTRLPDSEFETRLAEVRDRIAETDVDAGVWFDPTSVEYLTGFHHIQTERPVLLAVTPGTIGITVPRLEGERVRENPRIDRVHTYFDYPGGTPVETAVDMLGDLDVESVAADAEGAPATMGYEGPILAEYTTVATQDWVDRMRWAKSDAEVALIGESATWANLAHRYLADYTEPGVHPVTVSQRASMDASRAMLDALGARYAPRTRGDGPVQAGYISGDQTALPHGYSANRRIETGDVIVTGATAIVDGYVSELERTMFVGDPTDEQAHYFELMREAQAVAIEALGPGVPVDHVDSEVWAYFEEQGIADLARHHVGHNVGLDGHEPPYIDRGWAEHCRSDDTPYDEDDAVMEPGHVYTIEPGVYTADAGYRHSDTVVITDSGAKRLTVYPRDLDENVIQW